jgi:energy-coupling factor transporter ATP-binding protein EcfA2
MKDKLVVAVLGHRNSGKSTTWNTLFGNTVRTSNKVRRLFLTQSEYVDAFLVSGSPEERQTSVGKIIGELSPSLVLCSMQYRADVTQTIDYFLKNGYALFVQWLNPGYSETGRVPDTLGLMPYLLDRGATICVRDGQTKPETRVQELREYIYGWAWGRGLIRPGAVRAPGALPSLSRV